MLNHYASDLLYAIAISGLSGVRTETLKLAIVAALPPIHYRCTASLRGNRYLPAPG
jgi:hypothetical protein